MNVYAPEITAVKRRGLPRLAAVLCWGAALLNTALLCFFIHENAFQVPYLDGWDSLGRMETVKEQGFSWDSLSRWYGTHRGPFPRMLEYFIAFRTDLNLMAVIWLDAAVSLMTCGVIWYWIFRERRVFGKTGTMCLFAVSLLLLHSARPWLNWIWVEKMSCFISIFFAVSGLAILAAPSPGWKRLAAAGVCGFVSNFSLASGAVFWPAAFFLLLTRQYPNKQQRSLTLFFWAALSFEVLRHYCQGYSPLWYPPAKEHIPEDPLRFISFIFVYLGAWLCPENTAGSVTVSWWMGFIGLQLYVLFYSYAFLEKPSLRLPLGGLAALGMFSIGSAVLTALGRAGLGLRVALNPQYDTGCLFWLSIFIAAAALLHHFREHEMRFRIPLASFLTVIFGMAFCSSLLSLQDMKTKGDEVKTMVQAIVDGKPEIYKNLYFNDIEININHIRQNKLCVFRSDEALKRYLS